MIFNEKKKYALVLYNGYANGQLFDKKIRIKNVKLPIFIKEYRVMFMYVLRNGTFKNLLNLNRIQNI